ncbi:hypothetical protein DEO72_LG2g4809 [Vigna unguiculata]|uniref:Uncharacterized protein n=1 Tax=Vigna unguiculata TaxID=3917 RepID=A0A4D6L7S5_VIGUN|nr:hypothetical protein DEO72_LG2g4809 [Vigna unguiculata]
MMWVVEIIIEVGKAELLNSRGSEEDDDDKKEYEEEEEEEGIGLGWIDFDQVLGGG